MTNGKIGPLIISTFTKDGTIIRSQSLQFGTFNEFAGSLINFFGQSEFGNGVAVLELRTSYTTSLIIKKEE